MNKFLIILIPLFIIFFAKIGFSVEALSGKDIYLNIEVLPNGNYIPSNVEKGKDIYLNIEELQKP